MATECLIASGDQAGVFSYFHFNPAVHSHEKPYEILINLPSFEKDSTKFRRTNEEFEYKQVRVEDVRGREDEFSLDKNGVCWRGWEGPLEWQGIDVDGVKKKGYEWIKAGYIKAVEDFIKTEIEAQDGKPVDFVKVFDYKLRSSTEIKHFETKTLDLEDGLDPMIPVTHPHVDQSAVGAKIRVRVHMGDDADRLLRRRFRIVNVWKPLRTVIDWPLAICDSATVSEQDLVPTDLVRRKYVGETMFSKFNARHRWYYLSNQKPDEVTLLKIHDSRENAAVKFCLHSSFKINGLEEVPRESFEVRAFVFDPED